MKKGICSTCKWRYELEFSVGCNNPSPDRIKWAEYEHVEGGEPCLLWEDKQLVDYVAQDLR